MQGWVLFFPSRFSELIFHIIGIYFDQTPQVLQYIQTLQWAKTTKIVISLQI